MRAELKDRLIFAMTVRKVKAVDVCRLTGIPKSAVSYYISGKSQPKADRVYLIGKALNVSDAWLMGFDVPMERSDESRKADELVKIIDRLTKDADFYDTVRRLSGVPEEQYKSIKMLLCTLAPEKR